MHDFPPKVRSIFLFGFEFLSLGSFFFIWVASRERASGWDGPAGIRAPKNGVFDWGIKLSGYESATGRISTRQRIDRRARTTNEESIS